MDSQGGIPMKYQIIIDGSHPEEVLVYAHRESELTRSIARLCEDDAFELIGYRDREMLRLNLGDICCFIVEDNKIYALTKNGKWQLRCRLYTLEEALPDGFVKINQSCIAHIKMIERFDASFSGSLTVCFKNGYTDYVSRRNMKKVKERLGL